METYIIEIAKSSAPLSFMQLKDEFRNNQSSQVDWELIDYEQRGNGPQMLGRSLKIKKKTKKAFIKILLLMLPLLGTLGIEIVRISESGTNHYYEIHFDSERTTIINIGANQLIEIDSLKLEDLEKKLEGLE